MLTTNSTPNKRHFLKISFALAVMFSLVACGGGGSKGGNSLIDPQNQQKLVNGLIKNSTDYYSDFQSKLQVLQNANVSFCAAPSDTGFETLKTEWKNTFASWMSAQWVIRGPIDEEFRFNRVGSWPLASSRLVQRAVDQDIANSAELTESYIANRPVQAQGLPAIEYLLFSDGVNRSSISTRKCDLLKAISANLTTIISDVNNEWPAFANDIKNPGAVVGLNTSINLFANLFLNQLIIIKDDKLGSPLGFSKAGEKGNVSTKSGEAWVSRQSLISILNNIKALQALYLNEGGHGIDDYLISLNKAEVDQEISSKISAMISKIQGLVNEGITLHDNASDSRLDDLYTDARVLEVAVQNSLFPAIGASPTFNFNDGD